VATTDTSGRERGGKAGKGPLSKCVPGAADDRLSYWIISDSRIQREEDAPGQGGVGGVIVHVSSADTGAVLVTSWGGHMFAVLPQLHGGYRAVQEKIGNPAQKNLNLRRHGGG